MLNWKTKNTLLSQNNAKNPFLKKSGKILSPVFSRNPDFSGFFSIKTWAISCRFQKSKLNKNLLKIGGGDSKYTYTHNVGNLYINTYRYYLIKGNLTIYLYIFDIVQYLHNSKPSFWPLRMFDPQCTVQRRIYFNPFPLSI